MEVGVPGGAVHLHSLGPSYKLEHDWYFLHCSLTNGTYFVISQLLQSEKFCRHALADHKWLRPHVYMVF